MRGILLEPIITEKQTDITLTLCPIVTASRSLRVPIRCKSRIRRGDVWCTHVVSVNTMRYDGKRKQRYTKGGLIVGSTLLSRRQS